MRWSVALVSVVMATACGGGVAGDQPLRDYVAPADVLSMAGVEMSWGFEGPFRIRMDPDHVFEEFPSNEVAVYQRVRLHSTEFGAVSTLMECCTPNEELGRPMAPPVSVPTFASSANYETVVCAAGEAGGRCRAWEYRAAFGTFSVVVTVWEVPGIRFNEVVGFYRNLAPWFESALGAGP